MRKLWLIFSQVATVALAAWFVLATFQPRWLHQLQAWGRGEWHHASVTIKEVAPSSGSSVGKHPGFSVAAKRAAPAVVSIVTSRATNRNPRLNDPWFRFFFGEQGSRTQVGMGSGVIVSPDAPAEVIPGRPKSAGAKSTSSAPKTIVQNGSAELNGNGVKLAKNGVAEGFSAADANGIETAAGKTGAAKTEAAGNGGTAKKDGRARRRRRF